MKPIVEVKNLSVILDNKKVLEDITFMVEKGQVFVILGPNGAGKTTLLRALLGLVPYHGTVNWHTKRVSYVPPQEFIHRKANLPLTVNDFFKLNKFNDHNYKELLKAVDLSPDILNQQLRNLSTGQFQRVMIAWALLGTPDVILFDEPISYLDISAQQSIFKTLYHLLKKHHITLILVVHDLSIVWQRADHVLCINKRAVCYGKPTDVLTKEVLEKLYGPGVALYEHNHIS